MSVIDNTHKASVTLTRFPADETAIIFPGAFNPVHIGHLKMVQVAYELYGKRIDFEISIKNVDKSDIDSEDLFKRTKLLREVSINNDAINQLFVTNASKFYEKAYLWPGKMFIAGYDTLARISNPRYYADETSRKSAISYIINKGIKFIGFRRNGTTIGNIDPILLSICCMVPDSKYQPEDISSTAIRNAQNNEKISSQCGAEYSDSQIKATS